MSRLTHFPATKQSERLSRFNKPDKPISSVSEHVARVAVELVNNKIVDEIFTNLETEAITKFLMSKTGPEGDTQRTEAHFEITAINQIKNKIQSLADELKMMPASDEDPQDDV